MANFNEIYFNNNNIIRILRKNVLLKIKKGAKFTLYRMLKQKNRFFLCNSE